MRTKEVVVGKESKRSYKEGARMEIKIRVSNQERTIHMMRKIVTLTLILNYKDLCLCIYKIIKKYWKKERKNMI